MRVCLITDYLSPTYGWGRHALGVIRALRDLGVSIRLVSPRHLCDQADLAGLPDHRRVPSFVQEARGLLRLTGRALPAIVAASRGCDVLHCLTEPYVVPAVLAAGRRPLLVTAHGTYAIRPLTRRPDRWWLAWAYRRAARVVCVSSFTRAQLLAQLPAAKTAVVPEGIEAERFRIAPPPPAERPFLLSVAPIKRRKGYHVAIEAFARVHARRPDVEYWIAGATDDPVLLAELRERVAALGLTGAVRWLGRVDDETLIRLYHQCALMWLLPVMDRYQFEGFGLVYWEANACGRPVVGTTGCGAVDAIQDGVNGYLVPPDDPEAAAGAALRLLADPAAANAMGRRGRELVLPWQTAAEQLVALYDYHCQRAAGSPVVEPVTGYPGTPQ